MLKPFKVSVLDVLAMYPLVFQFLLWYFEIFWISLKIGTVCSGLVGYFDSISSSSSSSYRAGSTDIPDPLSPLLPIVHRPR